MMRTKPGSAISILLLLACGSNDQHDDESHVANAPELVPQEELRIGSVDDPDAGFSWIGGVTVDDQGDIYVLESRDRQVRVYDDQGRLLRRIGGEGEGPGEFRSPVLLGLQHDTLAIADMNLARVTLFLRSGELLETVSTPPVWLEPAPGVQVMLAPVRFTRDGFASSIVRTLTLSEVPHDTFAVPHVALDRTGQITDTLRFERWNLSESQVTVGSLDVTVPSGPPANPLYIDGEEGTYIVERPVASSADRAEFTITRTSWAGDTIYRTTVGYRPSTFSSASVDSIVALAVRRHLRNPAADSGAIAAAIRSALSLPAYQPPIVQGRIASDDVLWLQLYDNGTDQLRWMLFGPDGQLLGRVSLPRDARIHWSSGDRVLAVVNDEYDVPWLVRYRLNGDDIES